MTDSHWALYHLKNDPREEKNVYEDPAYREVVGRLTEKLVEKKRTLGDTDEEYPELQKRFRETTVVEDFQ